MYEFRVYDSTNVSIENAQKIALDFSAGSGLVTKGSSLEKSSGKSTVEDVIVVKGQTDKGKGSNFRYERGYITGISPG